MDLLNIIDLIQTKGGILLDVGCGDFKQPNFIGMDRRKLSSVDIVHDLEILPYPLPSESCNTILASHIYEHLDPSKTIDIMNEWWRLLKPDCELLIAMPYGWSYGFIQDPTHKNPANEATWQYFDPDFPLYGIYKPKPWRIKSGYPIWQNNGNMNVILIKRREDDGN